MPIKEVKEFLDNHQVKYVSLLHSPAFTSLEIAEAAHVSGKELAKTVVIKADDKLVMLVMPANDRVNFSQLREAIGAKIVDLASESEFKMKFTGCEAGAMPPFGPLYNMLVYLSNKLGKKEHIIFNAGTHAELMQMTYQDYEMLVKPIIIEM